MKRYGHGLVPGGFCPPHAGHHHLVRAARDRCERLTVLVLGSDEDPLPLTDRVAWMREIHPDVLVLGTTGALPTAEPVDAVFTSDPYERCEGREGRERCERCERYGSYGREFGAEIVRVEPDRTLSALPALSTAAVRKDPAAHWDHLEPPVRAALTRRVVVLGADSTGATTLALALTDHYRRRGGVWARTRCVPDHGAVNGEGKPPRSCDFPVLAQRRAELEEEAARDGSPVLVCDGDAFAATIRHERYLGTVSLDTCEIAARGRQHLWLLTDHRGVGVGLGEGEGSRDGLRPWMTARLLARLTHTGRRTAVLTGPHEERLATAVAAVDALLAEPQLEPR